MPIYAFACDACGHQFDRLQKLSDPDPESCPQCGKAQVHRQVTAPSFRLAGSGWYETDFKTDRDKRRHLAGDGGETKPAGDAKNGESRGETNSAPAPSPAPAASPASSGAGQDKSAAAG